MAYGGNSQRIMYGASQGRQASFVHRGQTIGTASQQQSYSVPGLIRAPAASFTSPTGTIGVHAALLGRQRTAALDALVKQNSDVFAQNEARQRTLADLARASALPAAAQAAGWRQQNSSDTRRGQARMRRIQERERQERTALHSLQQEMMKVHEEQGRVLENFRSGQGFGCLSPRQSWNPKTQEALRKHAQLGEALQRQQGMLRTIEQARDDLQASNHKAMMSSSADQQSLFDRGLCTPRVPPPAPRVESFGATQNFPMAAPAAEIGSWHDRPGENVALQGLHDRGICTPRVPPGSTLIPSSQSFASAGVIPHAESFVSQGAIPRAAPIQHPAQSWAAESFSLQGINELGDTELQIPPAKSFMQPSVIGPPVDDTENYVSTRPLQGAQTVPVPYVGPSVVPAPARILAAAGDNSPVSSYVPSVMDESYVPSVNQEPAGFQYPRPGYPAPRADLARRRLELEAAGRSLGAAGQQMKYQLQQQFARPLAPQKPARTKQQQQQWGWNVFPWGTCMPR